MTINQKELHYFRSKLRILEREIEKALLCQTECCGVSLSQCHTLLELDDLKNASIITLSKNLDLDKSTLSRVIDGMVNLGIVNREINPNDRRYMNISLSENGKKIAKNINNLCNDYYIKVFKHIPEDKHESILESIMLFADAIKKTNNENNNCCK